MLFANRAWHQAKMVNQWPTFIASDQQSNNEVKHKSEVFVVPLISSKTETVEMNARRSY